MMRRAIVGFGVAAAVSLTAQSLAPAPEQPAFGCAPAVAAEGPLTFTSATSPILGLSKMVETCFDQAPNRYTVVEKPDTETVVIPTNDGGVVRFSRQIGKAGHIMGKTVGLGLSVFPDGEPQPGKPNQPTNTIDFKLRNDGNWNAYWTVAQSSQAGESVPDQQPPLFGDPLTPEQVQRNQRHAFTVGQLAALTVGALESTVTGGPTPYLPAPVPLRY